MLSGELTDAGAETVVTAIHAYTDPPTDDDTRTTSQRAAAALVQICQVALEHAPAAGRAPAHVSVVVDWSTITDGRIGRTDGEFTGSIHTTDVRRLLCDAAVARVVTGPDSLPLDVGRSRRTIPPAIRRAVIARDGGCRFPGCDRPPGWCQIHHVVHWLDGGRTAVVEPAPVLRSPSPRRSIERGWIVKFDGHDLLHHPTGRERAPMTESAAWCRRQVVTSKSAMSASRPVRSCAASAPRMLVRVMRNGPGCTVSASWVATASAPVGHVGERDDLVEEPGLDRLGRGAEGRALHAPDEPRRGEAVTAELDAERGYRHADRDLVEADLVRAVGADAVVRGRREDAAHRECVSGHPEHDGDAGT